MEGKTNISRHLKQFDGLTWLILTPPTLFYDRSTPLVVIVVAIITQQFNAPQVSQPKDDESQACSSVGEGENDLLWIYCF